MKDINELNYSRIVAQNCNMCPLWPLHYVILFFLLFLPIFYIVSAAVENQKQLWNVTFHPSSVPNLFMSEAKTINVTIMSVDYQCSSKTNVTFFSENSDIVQCLPKYFVLPAEDKYYSTSFNITGNFMGSTNVKLLLNCQDSFSHSQKSQLLPVTVMKKERLIDKIFTISVATLVSVVFINFGCALNLDALKESFKKPVGLAIGVISQFLFMPLISYVLAVLVFKESIPMQLGLFFTGISPSGGASNIWIYILGGNINLSVAITAISNICAFFMMPLWTFTLGRSIFHSGSMVVPYMRVASFAIALVPPLLGGLLLQKKCPKFSKFMVRILKPLSSCLILFIIIFATVTNMYLFKLFTKKILFVSFCLPLFGYLSSWLFACIFRRSFEDRLAISVETGVQNTGIAIFMLRFTLGQPEADLTTVVPVAVALMTPLPLISWYIVREGISYLKSSKRKLQDSTLKDLNEHDENFSSILISQQYPNL